jgi:hypothetical protein
MGTGQRRLRQRSISNDSLAPLVIRQLNGTVPSALPHGGHLMSDSYCSSGVPTISVDDAIEITELLMLAGTPLGSPTSSPADSRRRW